MISPVRPAWPTEWRIPAEPARACMFGFLYWLCFLLALEPGNLLNASQAGSLPSLAHETIRIGVAALLGAIATAIPALLTRKLPLTGDGWARRALIHAAGACALAFVLVVLSCFLAAWFREGAWLPSADEVHAQLMGNWLLLTYAVGALTAVLHVVGRPRTVPARATAQAPAQVPAIAAPHMPGLAAPLLHVPVKTRGETQVVDLACVAWIETQGNYLALHTQAGSQLVRETLSAFERKLDPARFIRIHRRVIVAIDRIAGMTPAGNGDALVSLVDGQELRVSRSYREALKARLGTQLS
jgi:two-component system LytT family response regulator